mmetsp:Transcript_33584/g.77462  ORF Transcript_33584/g.77462 Transcript_33584/m.77462 type:complete len:140 (-) Transcript_33584:392-811(-)
MVSARLHLLCVYPDGVGDSHPINHSEAPSPTEVANMSMLRQTLENAMAVLSPLERDVIRLRLGLNDGVRRTARQVSAACGGRLSTGGMFLWGTSCSCLACAVCSHNPPPPDVRKTEKRAYDKLRSPSPLTTRLRSFLIH